MKAMIDRIITTLHIYQEDIIGWLAVFMGVVLHFLLIDFLISLF